MNDNERTNRPVSTAHLVFGIVFTGIAAVKFLGEATNANLPRSAIGFPVVLIGAGIVGLIATVVNNRRRSRAAAAQTQTVLPPTDPGADPGADTATTVLETEHHDDTTEIQEQS